jgi:hypothetical protein
MDEPNANKINDTKGDQRFRNGNPTQTKEMITGRIQKEAN